jgi:hypothetical protein
VALVELPRRAASNLMESGRWPRRSTSALAATAVLRPLDADEVRHKIALLAGGSRPSPPSASCILAGREFPGIAVSLSAKMAPDLRQYEGAARSSPTPSCNH